MNNKIYSFLEIFGFWLLLSWSLRIEELAAGAVFSLITVFISDSLFGVHKINVRPTKYLWLLLYAALLFWDLLRSCANSLLALCSPVQKDSSVILSVRTSIKSDTALGLLGGTISMLTGALSAGFDPDKKAFLVYSINANNDPAVLEMSLAKYERLLKKVYE